MRYLLTIVKCTICESCTQVSDFQIEVLFLYRTPAGTKLYNGMSFDRGHELGRYWKFVKVRDNLALNSLFLSHKSILSE